MTATVQTITATILIQVGADQPKPIGTIQIPIEVTVGGNQQLTYLHSHPPGVRGIPDDRWLTDKEVQEQFPFQGKMPVSAMTAEQLHASNED